jgi:hypothetical protein
MIVAFNYLDCCIEIDMPDPEDGNVIYITLNKAPGTYDPEKETGFLSSYQISAAEDDPNQWLAEAVSSAINGLGNRGIKYYEQRAIAPVLSADIDAGNIPF